MGGVVTSWRLEWRAAVWLLLPRCCRAAVGEFCQRTVEKGHDTAPAGTRVTENVSCVPSFKQLFQLLQRSIFIIFLVVEKYWQPILPVSAMGPGGYSQHSLVQAALYWLWEGIKAARRIQELLKTAPSKKVYEHEQRRRPGSLLPGTWLLQPASWWPVLFSPEINLSFCTAPCPVLRRGGNCRPSHSSVSPDFGFMYNIFATFSFFSYGIIFN